MDGLLFLKQALRAPGSICAVAPSSASLARKVVSDIDWSQVRNVLEYGPGTGVFTEAILSRLSPEGRLLAIEINEPFVSLLSERYPRATICHGSVLDVVPLCRQHGIEEADVVISGLPWNDLDPEDQVTCLEATARVLKPGGQFVTFAYLPGFGPKFRRRLEAVFSEVRLSSPVWRNVPPAFLYRCRR